VNSANAYSQVANKQLDSLEAGSDVDLYNAVLDACELILRLPAQAQARSTAIATAEGIRLRLPVAGRPPYKVFWSSDGPPTEAVFPHPYPPLSGPALLGGSRGRLGLQ
jgi:hypothetical protein